MLELPERAETRREVLRRVRGAPGARLRELRSSAVPDRQVLFGVRSSRWSGRAVAIAALRRAGSLHSETSRGKDPDLEGRPRRRAQAGDHPLCGPQGVDGAPRRPRPGGGSEAPRSGARAHDGGRPPLRRHRQSSDGGRDHGAVRRAACPRGPCCPRVLRGAADAGIGEAVRRRHPPDRGHSDSDPGGPELGRGGRAIHRQRSAYGLHGGRPDDAPRRAHGADGDARLDLDPTGDPDTGGRLCM